jgi:hypothetical protein
MATISPPHTLEMTGNLADEILMQLVGLDVEIRRRRIISQSEHYSDFYVLRNIAILL